MAGQISDLERRARERLARAQNPQAFAEFERPAVSSGPRFYADIERQRNQLQGNLSQGRSAYQQALERFRNDYDRTRDTLGDTRERAEEQTQEDFANRGILRSGIYANEQSRLEQRHTDALGQLEDLLAQNTTQANETFGGLQSQIEALLNTLAQEQTTREQTDATAEQQAASQAEQDYLDTQRDLVQSVGTTALPQGVDLRSGGVGGDAAISSQEGLMQRIRDIFENRNVGIAANGETEDQRIARIAQEVLSGQRDLNNVRESVGRIAGINTPAPAPAPTPAPAQTSTPRTVPLTGNRPASSWGTSQIRTPIVSTPTPTPTPQPRTPTPTPQPRTPTPQPTTSTTTRRAGWGGAAQRYAQARRGR